MRVSLARTLKGALHLGAGELLGRLCTIATIILLGHNYGVSVVGVFTLGMTASFYMQPIIDFGLRHIGARTIARYPLEANAIMHRVQRRRLSMAAGVLPLTLLYALLAKLPPDMKLWLFVFSATGMCYAFSLEWAAWGREQLGLLGMARSLVPLGILFGLLLGWHSQRVLWWIMLGNALGFLSQALLFRIWWARGEARGQSVSVGSQEVEDALALRRAIVMGFSTFCVLAFSSIDMLMLGVMCNSREVGLYSAAYRVLNQTLVTYYLLTSAIYPQLARQSFKDRKVALSLRILVLLSTFGIAIAVVVTLVRRPLITIMFGPQFEAAGPLLLLVVWAVPLDFLTSYLNTAYIAWGMEKKVLSCMAIAATSNVILNIIWIPRHGAMAAAVNTLLCYAILLGCLMITWYSTKELASPRSQELEISSLP
jgi:O-antigen/teichoic acid export membrane protein